MFGQCNRLCDSSDADGSLEILEDRFEKGLVGLGDVP